MFDLNRDKPVSLRLLMLGMFSIVFVFLAVWWGVIGRSSYPVIVRFKLWADDGSFVFPVVFAPDDSQLLAINDHAENASLWIPTTGEQILTFEKSLTDSADALAFTPDSSNLVAANSLGEVRVWDPKSGALLKQFDIAHEPPVITKVGLGVSISHPCSVVVLSPNAARIACSYPNEDAIRIWSVAQSVEERTLKHSGRLEPLLFSTDGSFLVLIDYLRELAIWDLQQPKPALPFGSQGDMVLSACLSSDNRVLATGSRDGVIKLWDLTTGEEIQTLQGECESIECLAFDPNGKSLAAGMGRTVHPWWTALTGKSWLFASSVGRVQIWDVATGRPIEDWDEPTGSAVSLSYSPDGRLLVIGCSDSTVSVRSAPKKN